MGKRSRHPRLQQWLDDHQATPLNQVALDRFTYTMWNVVVGRSHSYVVTLDYRDGGFELFVDSSIDNDIDDLFERTERWIVAKDAEEERR